jgi:hypothetical protein
MGWQTNNWNPQTITRYVRSLGTSTGVAVVDTDCGEGYLKSLGNPEGPHVLACELVGSLLAEWFILPTLDFSIIQVEPDDEIPLGKGTRAESGPAFISRSAQGFSWGGDEQSLQETSNKGDITRLIVFDTWVRNCDRYRPAPPRINRDNVFWVQPQAGALPILTAIDHTHTFTCGRELTRAINRIDLIQDPIEFGLFPEFLAFRDLAEEAVARGHLQGMHLAQARQIVDRVPFEWLPDQDARAAWSDFITRRAQFLSSRVPQNASGVTSEESIH